MTENLPDTNVGTIEYISKQDAIDIASEDGKKIPTLAIRIMNDIKAIPAADVAPVVRCRNCARLNRNGYCTRFQNNISGIATSWFMPDDDDFCSYGERKE